MSKRKQSLAIFSEPWVQANCRGVPIYSYGYTQFLAGSPDLVDDARVQAGNAAALAKVPSKKSWEISSNCLGATPPRMPRSIENDYQPLEAIHLIDGDPQTVWCSKNQQQGDVEPAWIRLDLVMERPIARIVLRKRVPQTPRNIPGSAMLDQGAVEVGRAMPARLTIRLARDNKTWQTVFDGPSGDAPDRDEFVYEFHAQQAKQIWIVGAGLPRVENFLHAFSIAGVEVYGQAGQNLAPADRGTGVTVSSVHHGLGQTRDEHRWLWPIHADLGLKYVRVGYHDDPINWHWVEKTPGKLAVDAEADESITYLTDRGLDIVMALGFGNRHHTQKDPTRRLPQLWEWYYEDPAPPTTPKALAAWLRYVRFIVRHFRDRVKYFEVWNEWNVESYWGAPVNPEQYFAMAGMTIPVIRKLAPRSKVMLGSLGGFAYGMAGWSAQELAKQEKEHLLLRAVAQFARDVDVIGYHPFYQRDPDSPEFLSYVDDVRALQAWARGKGFRGEFIASEWTVGGNYPDVTPPNWWGLCNFTEMQKAKIVAHLSVVHTALGVGSFFCETWSNTYPLDLTLLRRGFAAYPIAPQQPQAAYYVVRNLATALDGLKPAKFAVRVGGIDGKFLALTMARGRERVLAIWRTGRPADACPGTPCDIEIEGHFRAAQGYDPMNGTTQPLNIRKAGKNVQIPGVLVRDYPVLIRLK